MIQRRKADADGKPGPIRPNKPMAKSNCEGELAAQLARRTQIINDVSHYRYAYLEGVTRFICRVMYLGFAGTFFCDFGLEHPYI